jgi:hypothetical protein
MNWLALGYGYLRRFFLDGPFVKCLNQEITDEVGEEFLKLLLKLFNAARFFDPYLNKSLEGFEGSIQLMDETKEIRVLLEFKNGKMKTRELKPKANLNPPPQATIVFKNYAALMNFLLPEGGRKDLLRSILENELRFEGNFNYIYRFAFLTNHVQLPFFRKLEAAEAG